MLQRKAFHFVSSSAAASQAENFEGRLTEVVDLLNAGDFASTVQKCDEALGEFPTSPEYLRSKGIALFGMGDSRAANEALGLCFEINPDDAEHYVVVIQACASLGQILWARKWAHEGAKRARDRREIYRAWFEVEEQAEHAKLMRMCLGQLRLLEEPQQSLEELRMRLQGLEERLARCERELEDAWRSLQQRRLEDAERISRRLTQEHPHHMPALFLSGVLAIEQERWADAISHLRRAFLHRPLAEPDVPFLLGHAYLKLGKVYHATVMHFVWQDHYNEAAAALDSRGLHEREGAGALAVLTFESEYERRLAQDATALAQQGLGILRTYGAVSDADPEAREQIAEIVHGTNRLLGWLAGGSYDGR
jgi:tetratricopeptide (TPR) repeat protein